MTQTLEDVKSPQALAFLFDENAVTVDPRTLEEPVYYLQDIHTGAWVEVSEKHCNRVQRCCVVYYAINPATGRRERVCLRCKDAQFCRNCFDKRMDAEREKVQQMLDDPDHCYVLNVPEAEDQATAKRLRRKGVACRRYPMAGGMVRYVQDESEGAEGTRTRTDAIDWVGTLQTPDGKHISGSGNGRVSSISQEDNEEGDHDSGENDRAAVSGASKKIVVEHVHVREKRDIEKRRPSDQAHIEQIRPLPEDEQKIIDELVDDAYLQATLATLTVNNPPLEFLQRAVNQRQAAFRQALEDKGLVVVDKYTQAVTVHESEIDWQTWHEAAKKRSAGRGYYNDSLPSEYPEEYQIALAEQAQPPPDDPSMDELGDFLAD